MTTTRGGIGILASAASMARMARMAIGSVVIITAGALPPAIQAANDGINPPPGNSIGYQIELDNLPSPHPRPENRPAAADANAPAPIHVRVGIPWAQVEKSAGQYDWAVVDEIVLSHAQAGYAVVLHPRGDNSLYQPLASRDQASVDAWTTFLRALATRYKDEAASYALGTGVQDLPPRDWGWLLKLSSVMIQSADPGAKVVMWGLDASRQGSADWLDQLYREDVAAYVDVLALAGVVAGPGTQAAPGELAGIKAQMQLHDPSATVWLEGPTVPGGLASGGALLRGYLQGVAQESALTLFTIDFGAEGTPPLLAVMERIRACFLPAYTPLVESGRGITMTTSMGQPVPITTLRLFDADAKKVLIAYDPGAQTARGGQAVLSIDTFDLADPVLKDVAAGESAPLGAYQKDEKAGLTRAAVPLAEYPLVLEYRRFTTPLFGEGETLQVTEKRLPSVAEILARHQAVQAAQDALLQNLRSEARVDFHFRIGTGSNLEFNVSVLNNYFFDPKVGGEFEQKEFFVNGVKWRSDRMPELPLPQPEKVMTLPLDISLDKRYAYSLAGEETVDGYDCWMIDFEPLEAAATLYKGRVWIDKKSFVRVQISSLQTGLEPPIISNDEKDSYRPVVGPDGLTYWLLTRIDGQQVFSTAGRNLVLVREVAFSGHIINDTSFEEHRRQAYASPHQILRDTAEGQRYLERTPDGGRVVSQEVNHDYLFLLGGVFYNHALDFPVPLAGINYFNSNLGGRGLQTNVFFAGVLAYANLADPALFGTKLDASVDVFGQGFSFSDRPVSQGREKYEQGVANATQSVTAGLGIPFADYWKLKLTADVTYQTFHRDEDARRFVVPEDHIVSTLGLQGEFNRKAWSVVASAEGSRRGDWECWGRHCAAPTAEELNELDDAKTYVRYQGTVSKDFYLPLNQKVNAGVTGFGGSDLDRFSQYKFGFFDNRLRGFGGAGYRFDQGAKGRLQYAFNLGTAIRFDATLDHARVKDHLSKDDGYNSFTGFGISGQTIVGPNLIVSLDWGIALDSSVEAYRGDQEILLSVLRLFR